MVERLEGWGVGKSGERCRARVSGGGKPSGGDESASSASYAGASSVLGYQPAPGEEKDKNIIDNLLRTHDIVHLAEELEEDRKVARDDESG